MYPHNFEFIAGITAIPSSSAGGCVATIGAFDGVHVGHQQLLRQVFAEATARMLPSLVIIFEPQPNEYFTKEEIPARLMRLREKIVALADVGVDRVLCLKFDQRLRSMSAEQFVNELIVEKLSVKSLIIGDDFRFGCDRDGDFEFLQRRGRTMGFVVRDTDTHVSGDARVSSTRIRGLLNDGRLDDAAQLLGRRYSNIGRVVYGQQLGRTLGFPTLNIALGRSKMPLQGVYTVRVQHSNSGKVYRGVANLGVRPTVNGGVRPLLEVHLIDENVNFYGECLKVEYLQKLREEKKFGSVDELRQQISEDIFHARALFSAHP